MTCDEARETFSEFYDDMLSGARLMDLTQHLDECPDCRAEWAAFSMSVQVVNGLGMADPLPGFAARVRQQIEAPPWWRRLARTLFVPLPVKVPIHVVALAVLSFAGLMLFQRSPELRREAEVKVAPPPPAARQAPPPGSRTPAPPRAGKEKAAPAGKGVGAPEAPSKVERAEGEAASPDASAPPPPAPMPLEKKERAPSSLQAEAPKSQSAAPLTSPQTGAGRSAEPQATAEDLRMPLGRLQSPPPPQAESRGAAEDLRPPAGRLQSGTLPPAQPRAAPASPTPPAPAAPPGPDRLSSVPAKSPDELFSSAATQYAQQEYDRAIEGLNTFIATHPQDPRVADARYLLGDSYFLRRRYAEAIPEFDTLIRQFPDSRRIPGALYRGGQARLSMGDRAGCQLLREVATRYPQAREAASAREDLSTRCP